MPGFLDFVGKLAPIATIGAGVIGAIGANKAAGQQAAAIDRASGLTQAQFDQIREDFEPFRLGAVSALERLLGENIGPLEETPDFLFARGQGEGAINRSLAARGKVLSGQAVKAGQEFATNLARRFAGDRRNVLSTIAGFGPTSAGAVGTAGLATGGRLANLALQRGDATASSFLGPIAAGNRTLESLITQAALAGAFG